MQTWRYGVDARQHGFFLAKKVRWSAGERSKELGAGDEGSDTGSDRGSEAGPPSTLSPTAPDTPGPKLGFTWEVASIADFESGFLQGTDEDDRFIAFVDPSTYPSNPGWMLRNLLVLARQRWKLDHVQMLCYRDIQSRRDEARSVILKFNIDKSAPPKDMEPSLGSLTMPKVTGWERNRDGKLASKSANLAEYMDPQR